MEIEILFENIYTKIQMLFNYLGTQIFNKI